MMRNIFVIQMMKKMPTSGTHSLDSGIFSATMSIKTVVANINVTATDNLSPDSGGRMNVVMVSNVIKEIGKIKFIK